MFLWKRTGTGYQWMSLFVSLGLYFVNGENYLGRKWSSIYMLKYIYVVSLRSLQLPVSFIEPSAFSDCK